MRHGSRYPNLKHVRKSQEFLRKVSEYKTSRNIRTKTVVDEIFATFNDKPHHGLSDFGGQELRSIAQRFRDRYADLLNKNIDDFKSILSDINIVSSDKSRCIDSGRNFIFGLFGNDSDISNLLVKNMILNNTMIRYFDECQRYQLEVKKNKKSISDLLFFKNGTEMSNLMRNLKLRNNLDELDFDTSIGIFC